MVPQLRALRGRAPGEPSSASSIKTVFKRMPAASSASIGPKFLLGETSPLSSARLSKAFKNTNGQTLLALRCLVFSLGLGLVLTTLDFDLGGKHGLLDDTPGVLLPRVPRKCSLEAGLAAGVTSLCTEVGPSIRESGPAMGCMFVPPHTPNVYVEVLDPRGDGTGGVAVTVCLGHEADGHDETGAHASRLAIEEQSHALSRMRGREKLALGSPGEGPRQNLRPAPRVWTSGFQTVRNKLVPFGSYRDGLLRAHQGCLGTEDPPSQRLLATCSCAHLFPSCRVSEIYM